VIEINEAFASVVLAWAKEIQPNPQRVNRTEAPSPWVTPGRTGAILMTKLLHELERRGGRYGLQTMCIGHGMATATVIEKAVKHTYSGVRLQPGDRRQTWLRPCACCRQP